MALLFKDTFRLKKGDKIGLITPSSPISKKDLIKSVENVKALGLKPEYCPSITEKTGFFAGTAQNRADELHHFIKRSDIKAIIAVRGGYGSFEMLDLLDYNLIRQYEKPIIGYSDLSALLSAIHKYSKIPVIHGPMALAGFSHYAAVQLKYLLFETKNSYTIKADASNPNKPYLLNSGDASGVLVGGNLSVLLSLLGTPYEPDFSDTILFLEEVNEAPYKIHRMLRQMQAVGIFEKTNAVIFGVLKGCENKTEKQRKNNYSLHEVLEQIMKPLNIPSVYGFPIGHIKDTAAVPVGLSADFSAENFKLCTRLR